MKLSFRKWLEVVSPAEPAREEPGGDLPYPNPYKDKRKKAKPTHALATYASPGSDELPPDPHVCMVQRPKCRK